MYVRAPRVLRALKIARRWQAGGPSQPLPHAYVLDAVPLPPQSNSLAQVQEAPRQELFITHHAAQPAQRLVWVAQGWTCKVVSHVCVIKEERKEDLTS